MQQESSSASTHERREASSRSSGAAAQGWHSSSPPPGGAAAALAPGRRSCPVRLRPFVRSCGHLYTVDRSVRVAGLTGKRKSSEGNTDCCYI